MSYKNKSYYTIMNEVCSTFDIQGSGLTTRNNGNTIHNSWNRVGQYISKSFNAIKK